MWVGLAHILHCVDPILLKEGFYSEGEEVAQWSFE